MSGMGPLIGGRLLVDIHLDKDGQIYETTERWSKENTKTIRALGYLPARGYKQELRYAATKVYIRLWGFRAYDIRSEECPNLETSSTLYDYLASDAQKDFLKGMSKVAVLSDLDMKKLGSIGLVAIGIVFGLFLLMGS